MNHPTFIYALSGGIDSVVLLHMLVNGAPEVAGVVPPGSTYIAVHVNHGIRPDNETLKDEQFCQDYTEQLGIKLEVARLQLGPDASEEKARTARYKVLEAYQQEYRARAIILAHHHDDVVETAVINMLRGTKRRGLSSLKSTDKRLRPLLGLTKEHIRLYASTNALLWVEDSTNTSNVYLRNKVRTTLSSFKNEAEYGALTKYIEDIHTTNAQLDKEIESLLRAHFRTKLVVSRRWFVKIPHDLACEIVYALLRKIGTNDIDHGLVERLVVAMKVARPGTSFDVDTVSELIITKRSARFVHRSSKKTHTL